MSYPPPGQPAPQPAWSPPPNQPGYGGYGTPPAYGGPAYGAPVPIQGLAGYGKRVVGYIIDYLVVLPFLILGFVLIVTGDTELARCSDGIGLCEEPTGSTLLLGFSVMALSVPLWFAYHAWEGATGKTLGKLAVGIRLVDHRTMEPVGAWRGIGRGVVESLISQFSCGLGSLLDLLWPAWDDKNQSLHDKALSSVVVEAAYLRPKGTTPASVYGAPPAYQTAPPAYQTAPTPYGAPQPAPYGPPTSAPPAPGSPGSPTDPFGRPPPSSPF